jgi:FlaA1/EpsC-like NDP-sugar epimerase
MQASEGADLECLVGCRRPTVRRELNEERSDQRKCNMNKIDGFASYPSLRDRVIVVTGGASGIGEAIVEAFAKQNAQVAFLDIQDEAAEQLTERLGLDGATVPAYYCCDLTDIAQVQQTCGAF